MSKKINVNIEANKKPLELINMIIKRGLDRIRLSTSLRKNLGASKKDVDEAEAVRLTIVGELMTDQDEKGGDDVSG